jgi:hypothetical protein
MITEKDTIKCESIFNDEHTHRLYWKRVWGKDKPLATVIMINPCIADNLLCDNTTFIVCNSIAKMEKYGGVIICNLYSKLTSKLDFRWSSDEDLNDSENDTYICKAADESEVIIFAWGSSEKSNSRIAVRANMVINLLKNHKNKLFTTTLADKKNIHPLTPALRSGNWNLKPFEFSEEQETESIASTTA